jgi:hypothetical protein
MIKHLEPDYTTTEYKAWEIVSGIYENATSGVFNYYNCNEIEEHGFAAYLTIELMSKLEELESFDQLQVRDMYDALAETDGETLEALDIDIFFDNNFFIGA